MLSKPTTPDLEQTADGDFLYGLTVAYFLLPCLIFDALFVRWYIGVPVAVALTAAAAWDTRGSWGSPSRWGRRMLPVVVMLLAAGLWTSLFGVGYIGYETSDQARNHAIFKALFEHPWPVEFPGLSPAMRFLSYPLGFYLPAAAAGKLFGWSAGLFALFVWAALGIALVWSWLRVFFGRYAPLAIAIFILFSGLDIVGWSVVWPVAFPPYDHLPAGGSHIEWWSGHTLLQYSSNATIMAWTTQLSASQWLLPCALLHRLVSRGTGRGTALLLSVATLWGHLTLVGAAVFLPLYLTGGRLRSAIRDVGLVALAHLALIGAFYLSKDVGALESGWLWEIWPVTRDWPKILLFLLLEVLVLVALIDILRPRWHRDLTMLLVSATVMLLLIPLYSIGWSNDFGLKVSSIPLFVLFILLARVTAAAAQDGRRAALWGIGLYVAVAGYAPLYEMIRSIDHIMPGRFAMIDRTDDDWKRGVDRRAPECFLTTRPRNLEIRPGDEVQVLNVGRFPVSSVAATGEALRVCTPPGTVITQHVRGERLVRYFRDGTPLTEKWRFRQIRRPDEAMSITNFYPEQYTGSVNSLFHRHLMRHRDAPE